ncbi:hypothetical protein GHT06_008026 [Daphnia sinensis]|uniref:Uncharacterized protein n=1 Tax=Daphnia sinensis TaxID=1820382 RepID=A0AAD5LUI7_9CRUS|nr:hypothetical protein GHT06_008026 [Daphnia sinensis]
MDLSFLLFVLQEFFYLTWMRRLLTATGCVFWGCYATTSATGEKTQTTTPVPKDDLSPEITAEELVTQNLPYCESEALICEHIMTFEEEKDDMALEQPEDVMTVVEPHGEIVVPVTIAFQTKNEEFVKTNTIMGDVTDLLPEPVKEPEIKTETELKMESETDLKEDTPLRPAKRVTFATKTEEIPPTPSKTTRFRDRLIDFLLKIGFVEMEDDEIVQVTMDDYQVEMMINHKCFDSIISQDQWRKLGEPELKPMTEEDWTTFKPTGKYKNRVAREEIGGYFYSIVKLLDKVMILPIYVYKKDKVMPNLLGRRLYYDLHLHGENAPFIRTTRKNEMIHRPSTANCDETAVPINAFTTLLRILIEKSKEKDQERREKYEGRMSEFLEKESQNPEMTEEADATSFETKPKVSSKDPNYAKTNKTIMKLHDIYIKDHKRSYKTLREAEKKVIAIKKQLACASLESERIVLTEAIQQREQALNTVMEEERREFAEKMEGLAEARKIFLKPSKKTKLKKFVNGIRSFFGLKSKN